ncbi:Mix23p KNAG_0C04290 [Huiozyma naganishii CBS 8797]|uniref:Uncharacterized protein n=1 Tax=Huiozyma naganishii (strain ATCC MYA-139 / BCRC 22969 / CBS 8797 / KCTC 17520 / NBRC 10181 / NCYC 3082 / Yp74L-3) TaxID=1071383 RepID=J7S651_HUIN7|nr:hypothetical protein KNAG_0C04290 [Kazachstania naganishii CBS 8797]CCK69531.1 hypothetical protein KNAG_0C04290 [Kazachstania naganishii CBS 8797]
MGREDSITIRAPSPGLIDADDDNLKFSNGDNSVSEITLTRKVCIESTLVDSFLQTLRHISDDKIKQRLNSYNKQTVTNSDKLQNCNTFVQNELFPNWEARSKAITFCQRQADELKAELDVKYAESSNAKTVAVDARLDPYGERDLLDEQESKYSSWSRLNDWVKNSLIVESILQNTSDHTLKRQCDASEDYLEKFKALNKSLTK